MEVQSTPSHHSTTTAPRNPAKLFSLATKINCVTMKLGGSLVPRPHPAHARRRGLVSQDQILGLAPEAWSGQSNHRSSIHWNNAEARTSTTIKLLKACYEIHYPTLSNL